VTESTLTAASVDEAAARYLEELVGRLRAHVELRAAYLLGSGALGGYVPGESDLDVVAVGARPLAAEEKQRLVKAASHDALPCPARKLELVLYAEGAQPPDFELNLNTGRDEQHVSVDPADESPHWFLIDASIAEQHAVPLLGPQWDELFAPVPAERVRAAVEQGLRWAEAHEPDSPNTELNARRARRYLDEGVWVSKREVRG
jgi:predicted nucleotidyltransferase